MTQFEKILLLPFIAVPLIFFSKMPASAQMNFGEFKLESSLISQLDKDIGIWVYKKYTNFNLLWIKKSDINNDIGLIFSANKEQGNYHDVLVSFVYRKTDDGWVTFAGAETPSMSDTDMNRLTTHVNNILNGDWEGIKKLNAGAQ